MTVIYFSVLTASVLILMFSNENIVLRYDSALVIKPRNMFNNFGRINIVYLIISSEYHFIINSHAKHMNKKWHQKNRCPQFIIKTIKKSADIELSIDYNVGIIPPKMVTAQKVPLVHNKCMRDPPVARQKKGPTVIKLASLTKEVHT